VHKFVEQQFLDFADAYFTPSGLHPTELRSTEEPPVSTA
jgi:hypothetical protein